MSKRNFRREAIKYTVVHDKLCLPPKAGNTREQNKQTDVKELQQDDDNAQTSVNSKVLVCQQPILYPEGSFVIAPSCFV
jgi:hypothetical protein